jgi:hypothetical protein
MTRVIELMTEVAVLRDRPTVLLTRSPQHLGALSGCRRQP